MTGLSREEVDAICDQIAAMVIRAVLANAQGDVKIAKQIVRQCIRLARCLPVTSSPPSIH